MVIVPVEKNTLEVIAAMNKGVKPKIDPLEHSCFIYYGEDKLTELVPTVYVGTLLASSDYSAVTVDIVVRVDNLEETGR